MKLRIKEVLKEKGLTSVWLASQIGITQPNMSNIVSCKTNPSLDTLERIAEALNVSIIELFEPESEFYGVVLYKGITYKVDGFEPFKRLLNAVLKNSPFQTNCPECSKRFNVNIK